MNIGSVSVVAPVYNEEDNVDPFCEAIFDVMQQLHLDYEVIMVDDGSTDHSFERLRAQAGRRPALKVVSLRRNFGQSAALMAGIDHAAKEVIVLIDADLQNDPRDIPRLLQKIDDGYDIRSRPTAVSSSAASASMGRCIDSCRSSPTPSARASPSCR